MNSLNLIKVVCNGSGCRSFLPSVFLADLFSFSFSSRDLVDEEYFLLFDLFSCQYFVLINTMQQSRIHIIDLLETILAYFVP